MTQNLQHFAFRCCSSFWIAHNTHNDLLTVYSSIEACFWNENIPVNALIIRQNETVCFVALKHAYYLKHCALHDPYNFTF
ncbi:hypothetical protein D3C79_1077290 [compost metagenome]